jgi:hypothetical protein
MSFYTDAELLQCVGSAFLSGGLPATRGSRDPVALALLIAIQLSLDLTFTNIAGRISTSTQTQEQPQNCHNHGTVLFFTRDEATNIR